MIFNNYITPGVSSTLLLVMLTFLLPAVINGQTASFSRTDYPLLGNNHIVADLNNDGFPDLAGSGTNSAAVMLGNGNGTFRTKVEYPSGAPAQDLASGDFNGDGKIDLVVSLNDPQVSLSLLTGNGDGSFNAPVTFANSSGFDSPAIVATDLDNDGRLDVVLAHAISCFSSPCVAALSITVLLGFGDGTFQLPFEIDVGTGMSRIGLGDFNRDGIKDLAIAGDSSRVYLLLGVGNGSFLQQPAITLTADTFGVDATDIDIADLNRDTIEDLVVALPLNGSRTAILIGNGDGTFRQPQIITEPRQRSPQYQVIADFNRDGFLDLAIALGWGVEGLMEILNGNGDGTFRLPVLYLVPASNDSTGGGTLAAGDFNRDGKPDIALPVIGAGNALAGLVNSTGASTTPPAFGSVTATPSTVVGGSPVQINISLVAGSVAPSGGLSFSIRSSNSSVLTVPSIVTMPAGSSSVSFNASTRSVTSSQDITVRVSNNQLGTRRVTVRVTPSSTTVITLSGLTLSPSSVTGGNSAQGTVILSGAATASTVVSLTSSNTVATVPASVTVPAGASSASFTITTASVTSTTSATITATLNGVTRSATLTINPVATSTDTVTISRTEYETSKRILKVEATSTSSNATLQVFVTSTGQFIGTLTNDGGGRYKGEFSFASNPQNITVRSSLGGVATRTVAAK